MNNNLNGQQRDKHYWCNNVVECNVLLFIQNGPSSFVGGIVWAYLFGWGNMSYSWNGSFLSMQSRTWTMVVVNTIGCMQDDHEFFLMWVMYERICILVVLSWFDNEKSILGAYKSWIHVYMTCNWEFLLLIRVLRLSLRAEAPCNQWVGYHIIIHIHTLQGHLWTKSALKQYGTDKI